MSAADTNPPKRPFETIRKLLRGASEAFSAGFTTPKSIREANEAGAEKTRQELRQAGPGYGVTFPRNATTRQKRQAMQEAAQHLRK